MNDETRIENTTAEDEILNAALRNFHQSVHAWSEAEYARPRVMTAVHPRVAYRSLAIASAALTVLLATGAGVLGAHERNVHIEQARLAAQRQAEQQRELAAQRAKESDDLLANVDRDVSREVPSALEPLAQMMDDDSQ